MDEDTVPPGHRTVQVHLTRRCNLQCLHCYSDSGPLETKMLDPEHLMLFLATARSKGYTKLSLSGGEPFLYPALGELTAEAKRQGWALSAVTNATLSPARMSAEVLERFHLLGISIDGPPTLHDQLRGRRGAFAQALRGAKHVRSQGVPFAFVHTLRRSSLAELEWLLELAQSEASSALRLHPLELVGQAAALEGESLRPADTVRAYLWARAANTPELPVDVDLVNRRRLERHPVAIWPAWQARHRAFTALADTLVVEPDGCVVPFTYGIDRSFALGHYAEAGLTFDDEARWQGLLAPLVERAFCELQDLPGPFFNWYEHLTRVASSGAFGPQAQSQASMNVR
jgi:MoaA/NifB/PqqE/SkfB family radical SAM enzyme